MTPVRSATHAIRRLLNIVRYRREAVLQRKLLSEAIAAVSAFPSISGKVPHALPGRLIVSLTSYPQRFDTLHLTLRSLLDQTTTPDATILWLAHSDLNHVPADVLALCSQGLAIQSCEDLLSYKKIIPARRDYPDSFVLIADDDVYYPPDWVATLVKTYDPQAPAINCRRAHRPKRSSDGRMRPYREWKFGIVADQFSAAADLMAIGVGGVLYPPLSLPEAALDEALFMSIAPHGDDLWLYWMARRNGWRVRQVGGKFTPIMWPGTQEQSLFSENMNGRNDIQIRALEEHFGPV